MDKKKIEVLDYWLRDEQEDQLKIIRQTLTIINNAQCKIIFAILNKHDNLTCPQIQQLGEGNLDKARVYQYLVKLEKLNFVNTIRTDNLVHYSLVKIEVGDFIDCINSNLTNVKIDGKLNASNFLEVNCDEGGSQKKYILDYNQMSYLQNCLNCFHTSKQKELLKMFFKKLYSGVEQSKANHEQQTTFADTEFVDSMHIQSTVSRSLIALANCNLITRTKEKNFKYNTLNVDHILNICGFLTDTTNLNFDKDNGPRKRILPRKKLLFKPLM